MLDNGLILIISGIAVILILVALRVGYLFALREMNRSNRIMMTHDPLTGLLNRQAFMQRLEERIREAGHDPLTVVLLNVNRFRWINDALGSDLGDLIIMIVAQQLRMGIEGTPDIARLSGDEFALILDHDTAESRQIVMDLIRRFDEQPVEVRGQSLQILASAGLAGYPQHGRTASELVSHADIALIQARQSYIHVVEFDPVMDEEMHDRLQLATELRTAIRNGELSLAYQPRIDLATGRIAAIEALLRWHHPELGHVRPSKFIPIAEQTGLIVPIGEWVLETACAQAAGWNWQGSEECRISINISVQQLVHPDFVAVLDDVLQRTGLNPKQLELELTESIFIENPQKISKILDKIKERGIRIAIDDFGKGYSSLNYLKRYPADTLKIDKEFITGTQSDTGQIITASVIQLARDLGLTVVAEGVEQSEQLAFLMRKGCNEVQGYLLCRPVPHDVCEQFLQEFDLQQMLAQLGEDREGWRKEAEDGSVSSPF